MNKSSIFLILSGLLLLIASINCKKKENKNREYYANNLSNELESIKEEMSKTDINDISNLLNEHGFLIIEYNKLSECEKFNYSLSKGFI